MLNKVHLAILATHPIQYYAPLYREIFKQNNISGKVLFASNHGQQKTSFDPGFGRAINWDIDLLDEYPHEFLNTKLKLGSGTHQAINWLTGIYGALKEQKYNCILIPGYRPIFETHGFLAARKLKIPIICRPEGYDVSPPPKSYDIKSHLRNFYLKTFYSRIGAYCSIGTKSRQHFMAHGGNSDLVFEAPYCVDNNFFHKSYENGLLSRKQWRKDFGIAEAQVVVLFAGKLIQRKNPLLLVQAIRAASQGSKIVSLWVGSGHLESEIQSQLNEIPNHKSIMVGFKNQNEISKYYSMADIHCLPSHKETWGLVVNETMNFGLPQITTSTMGCSPDLVLNKGTGFQIQNNALDELAASLKKLTLDNALRHQMGRNAVDRIAEFNPTAAAEGIAAASRFCLDRPIDFQNRT
jgi:glycosyltransferase involved in cell wall biosynthesis